MKNLFYLLIFTLLIGCSSTKLVNSWKNPEIQRFEPQKLLVVGMTQNLSARDQFEQNLKDELTLRGINTIKSLETFNPEFTHSKKTEEDIQQVVMMLKEKGFDAVLVTALKGIENKAITHREYYDINYRVGRFRNYYFIYQDIYYHPSYYDEYKVYHLETSLYDISSDDERTLLWTGYIDLIDPAKVNKTIKDYVDEVIKGLEKDRLITKR